MLFLGLGLVIGILLGAGTMHYKGTKDISKLQAMLLESHDRLKSVKSQLYKRRSTYKKKTNGSANGKKATNNIKKTNIKKAV